MKPAPYPIETGIEPTPKKQGRYPLAKMKCGDSFAAPIAEIDAIRRAVGNFSHKRRRTGQFKFSVQKFTKKTCRCWRVR